ncbi:MAG: 23S rRNA (uracil(1939)-C(5))-methyltransferase RlmD [Clostridia bacterium]|nr:23S rRNA (uracil(1939)-C(5))-methyltransferase RlmD [Clostridia bacterium]
MECRHRKECGACQLLHMPYPAQLRLKEEKVRALLKDLCPVEPILGMEDPTHYRNKVHAVLSQDKSGRPQSGIYASGTHRVIPVASCLIEHEAADRIIQSAVRLIGERGWKIYNEYTHRGLVRHLLVRVAEGTGEIMVVLVATTLDFPDQDLFVKELLLAHPEVTTVVINQNPRVTSAVLGTKEKTVYGKGYIEDILMGKRFRISPRSFYQVNGRQTEVLYRTALDMCGFQGNELLLDAYCGTGTIGLCASDRVRRLIGVEVNSQAVRDARENARLNEAEHCTFYAEDAGVFLVRAHEQGIVPDVVIMDPPRAGSTPEFLRTLGSIGVKKLVYVSCNPETMARDVRILREEGYQAQRAVPVDMFPCTEHVETVCLLTYKD